MKGSLRPLEGRLILDCSTHLPGPFVGKILAEMGARVLKVESPTRPDPARLMGAFYDDLNAMKEFVPLHLTDPEQRARFSELVKSADGLIEGFRPEAKRKLGLDAATLLAENPKLAVASIIGYPEESPDRDRAGHDLNFQAITGMLSLQQGMPGLPWADLLGAYSAATHLVALLDRAARTGQGGRIAIALSEVLLQAQSVLAAEYRATGAVPRHGEILFSGLFPCYRLYRAACGRTVAVGAIEPKFWEKLCSLLGVPELQFHGYAEGQDAKATIEKLQAAWDRKPWKDWEPLFTANDCCVSPVLDFSEVYGRGL